MKIPPQLGSGCKTRTLGWTCSIDHRVHSRGGGHDAAVVVVDVLIDVAVVVVFVVLLAVGGLVVLFANVLLVLHPPVLEPCLHLERDNFSN